MTIALPAEIRAMIAQGALFVVNHSGGKDSQALYAVVKKFVPRRQILIIHADLGDVEWEVQSHIRESIDPALPFIVCRNERRSLLQMVADRGLFPSPANRQCTSYGDTDNVNNGRNRLSAVALNDGRQAIIH